MKKVIAFGALAFLLLVGTDSTGQLAMAEAPLDASQPVSPLQEQVGDDDSLIYLPLMFRDGRPEIVLPSHSSVMGLQISELRFRQPEMIDGIRDAGASYWRSFLFWDEVEPTRTTPPTYDWSHYDELFGHAHSLGLNIIAEIQGNPSWAAEFPGGPPNDFDNLAQFMAAAVERYDGDGIDDAPGNIRIRHWELYNEPDNADASLAVEGRGWGYWGQNGAAYAQMLKRVYPVIKMVSPEAKVVFGGIAHEHVEGEDWPFNIDFFEDVLLAGGGPYFDVMNFHYYPLFAPNWAQYGEGVIGKTEAIRRKLALYGQEKSFMVTEAGMWSDAAPPYPPATDIDQIRYIPKLYARALAADIDTIIWFQYDDVFGVDDPARGLVDGDLASKPSRAAYTLTSEVIAGARREGQARDLGAKGEVYWFEQAYGRLAIAWTEDGSNATLKIRAASVERIHILGNRSVIHDASDGTADGITTVPYGVDPVFVRVP